MEINKGCYECEHHVVGRIMLNDDIPPRCAQKHSEVYEKWWKDNSTDTDRSKLISMPCCKPMTTERFNKILEEQYGEFIGMLRYE